VHKLYYSDKGFRNFEYTRNSKYLRTIKS